MGVHNNGNPSQYVKKGFQSETIYGEQLKMWFQFAKKFEKQARVSKLQVISDQFMNKIMNNPDFEMQDLKLLVNPSGFYGRNPSEEIKEEVLEDFNKSFWIDFDDLRESHVELLALQDFMVQVHAFFSEEGQLPNTTGVLTSQPGWDEDEGDTRFINIKISIPILPFSLREEGTWRYLMQNLRSSVRHELEHLFQYVRNPDREENSYQRLQPGSKERTRAYVADPFEHEAFGAGIRTIMKHPNRVVHMLQQHMGKEDPELQLGSAKQIFERYPQTRPFLGNYIQVLQKEVARVKLIREIIDDSRKETQQRGAI